LASNSGVPRRLALARVRLLRSNVTGLPLYAINGGGGRVCFLLWRGVGTCGSIAKSTDVLWAVNGGSRRRGQAVVGLVSDAIVALKVRIAGRWHRVTPRHNAFYLAYREPHLSVALPAVVAVTR
jgi:hypothetical protein